MDKKIVPKFVNYLTDWEGFELPNGVFNKGITACGATTLAIRDKHKTIICSPRNNLIENKHAQHPTTLLVVGRCTEQSIREYIESEEIPKILVSYDSLPKVARCIEDKSDWRVVVDEFQYLLSDSSMKSEVEIKLLECLKLFPYVIYMSATPILGKYLDRISWLKGLPYLELEWQNVEKIRLVCMQTSRPISSALAVVRDYKDGAFPKMEIDGNVIESRECVIYLNSVNNIVNIIKQTGLTPDEVNIIVGNNDDNNNQIWELGEGFYRGHIPLEGEPHKMFTFCTSTAFAGCDFYSTCASSFVISDSKRVNTTVDIATDLLQIAGRQRLPENPFRKHLTFVYNLNRSDVSETDFENRLKEKLEMTMKEIEDLNGNKDAVYRKKRIKDLIKLQKISGYKDSFTMYDEETDSCVVNELACLNEQYVYELQRYNYQNGIIVRKQISDSRFDVSSRYVEYEEQLSNSIKKEPFDERMKRYCDYKDGINRFDLAADTYATKYPDVVTYYNELGSKRIKALGYKEKALKNEIKMRSRNATLSLEFRSLFKAGTRMATEDIKKIMQSVYAKHDVKASTVVTHLQSKYGIKCKGGVKIPQKDRSRKTGYEFI